MATKVSPYGTMATHREAGADSPANISQMDVEAPPAPPEEASRHQGIMTTVRNGVLTGVMVLSGASGVGAAITFAVAYAKLDLIATLFGAGCTLFSVTSFGLALRCRILGDLADQVDRLERANRVYEGQLRHVETQLRERDRQIADSAEQIDQLRGQTEEGARQISERDAQLDEGRRQADDMRERLKDFGLAMQGQEAIVAQAEEANARLEESTLRLRELTEKQKHIIHQQEVLQEKRAEMQGREEEMQAERARMLEQLQSFIARAGEMMQEAEDENRELREQLREGTAPDAPAIAVTPDSSGHGSAFAVDTLDTGARREETSSRGTGAGPAWFRRKSELERRPSLAARIGQLQAHRRGIEELMQDMERKSKASQDSLLSPR